MRSGPEGDRGPLLAIIFKITDSQHTLYKRGLPLDITVVFFCFQFVDHELIWASSSMDREVYESILLASLTLSKRSSAFFQFPRDKRVSVLWYSHLGHIPSFHSTVTIRRQA